jgi:hypothetical protein
VVTTPQTTELNLPQEDLLTPESLRTELGKVVQTIKSGELVKGTEQLELVRQEIENLKGAGENVDDVVGEFFNHEGRLKLEPDSGPRAITSDELEAISPVITSDELTPQPSVSDAIRAMKADPKVFSPDLTPVKRTNDQLTQLAVFMGHIGPRNTPLSHKQLKALEETHGSLYSKMGRGIDTNKLRNPAARIEVQAGNALTGQPRVTRFKSSDDIPSPIVETPGSYKRLKELEAARDELFNANEFDVNRLEEINNEIANMGPINYRDPSVIQEVQKNLPEELRATSPEGVETTVKLIEVDEVLSGTVDDIRQAEKELNSLDELSDDDLLEMSKLSDSIPDDFENTRTYNTTVWGEEDDLINEHVPFRLNPNTDPDDLETLVGPELGNFDWFHGTRVDPDMHDLRFVDPDEVTTIYEWGPGVYLTSDVESAGYYAKALPSPNLPPETVLSEIGTVAKVEPTIQGRTLIVNQELTDWQKQMFKDSAMKAGAPLDVMKSFMGKLGALESVDGAWEAFYDAYRGVAGVYDNKMFNRFQRNVANRLREDGYEAILKLPDDVSGEAVLNILGKGGDELPFNVTKTEYIDNPGVLDMLTARANASRVANNGSRRGQYLETRSRLELIQQAQSDLQAQLDDLLETAEKQLDEREVLEDRLRQLVAEEKLTQEKIDVKKVANQQEEFINKYGKNAEDLKNNPCL